jgi:hypothetical protein
MWADNITVFDFHLLILSSISTYNDIRRLWNTWVQRRTQQLNLPFLKTIHVGPLYSRVQYIGIRNQRFLRQFDFVEEYDEGYRFIGEIQRAFPNVFFVINIPGPYKVADL